MLWWYSVGVSCAMPNNSAHFLVDRLQRDNCNEAIEVSPSSPI